MKIHSIKYPVTAGRQSCLGRDASMKRMIRTTDNPVGGHNNSSFSSVKGSKNLNKPTGNIKELLDELISNTMDYVNDSDPNWELDTPKAFGRAVFDEIFGYVDEWERFNKEFGTDFQDSGDVEDLFNQYKNYIIEEGGSGDFGTF